MSLTTSQFAALKAAILADPVLAPLTSGPQSDVGRITDAMNADASPAFIVWRTSVNPDDVMKNGMDWTRVDNLSIGKARIWDWMIRLGTFDPSKANIRAGIDAAWVGTSADLAVRAVVYTHCKRSATRAEKLFANTSGGNGSDATPAVMVFEGMVQFNEIAELFRV